MTSWREHRSRAQWLVAIGVVIAIGALLTLLVVYGGGGSGGY